MISSARERSRPALIGWPADASRREELAEAGTPCLLLVDDGAPIPAVAEGEDWIHRGADERDVAARLAELARRGRSVRSVDAVPMALPAGLTADEHRVAVRLVATVGSLVPRADLPVGDLDATIARLRRPLGRDGWTILRIGAAGFLIERTGGGSC
ncbi:hypothetical protein [Aquihabitans sp. McL0605]|uniref:hypothetical protein n=1 Tax=Aquihabitans sp. McL0605 TaxID=3415671 RepID=UPI003CE9AC8D